MILQVFDSASIVSGMYEPAKMLRRNPPLMLTFTKLHNPPIY